jgi:hypothetical protein
MRIQEKRSMRIQETKIMLIHGDADPQHGYNLFSPHSLQLQFLPVDFLRMFNPSKLHHYGLDFKVSSLKKQCKSDLSMYGIYRVRYMYYIDTVYWYIYSVLWSRKFFFPASTFKKFSLRL